MKIQYQSESKLIIGGVAGTLRWMIALIMIGVGIAMACGAFAWMTWKAEGPGMYLLPLGIGGLIGLAMFGVGVVQLFARERLVLDRATGRGTYESSSPIVTTGKPFKFKLADVDSVVMTTETIDTNVTAGSPGIGETKVCKAVLRVTKPRRAVTLDETQNGRTERVTAMAGRVAGFLGKTVERN